MRSIAALLMTFATVRAQAQDYAPPPPNMPDAQALKQFIEKTAELKKAVEALKPKEAEEQSNFDSNSVGAWQDVAIYLKAAEWMLRFNEWHTKDTGEQLLAVINAGMKRARELKSGQATWRDIRCKPVIRAYRSKIDGSLQPYSVTLPAGYGPDQRDFRVDVLLHGRDATISEVKFLFSRENAKSNPAQDTIIIEPYGRGNNAYRWAGETDVFEALQDFELHGFSRKRDDRFSCLTGPRVIRGFSMGGAGTWHIGLHHPFQFAVMAPGAGFSVTRGYIRNLGEQPDYIERCLRIYDAVDCAENLGIIPCVAYSGEKDPQIAAVRNIEARLSVIKTPTRFTHIIGTGLEHKMTPEWWTVVDARIREHLKETPKQSFRYIFWTPRYGSTPAGHVLAMENLYERGMVEGVSLEPLVINTSNVRVFDLNRTLRHGQVVTIDDHKLTFDKSEHERVIVRERGNWRFWNQKEKSGMIKQSGCQGPIDDAFQSNFSVIGPSLAAWHQQAGSAITARLAAFDHIWNKYQRSLLPTRTSEAQVPPSSHLVLFGDPASNPLIADYLPLLPVRWTKEKLSVNGRDYDPATHFPVMIYPHPRVAGKYLVINSGHTFHEDAFKGTNALLYPRLGDWAVLKLSPTKDDPHHTEAVDAGLFDQNWQFTRK